MARGPRPLLSAIGAPSRVSDWIVLHPVLWAVGLGASLVLVGLALGLGPIVVAAAGAGVGVLNLLHARRRGYCPVPAAPGPLVEGAVDEAPVGEGPDGGS